MQPRVISVRSCYLTSFWLPPFLLNPLCSLSPSSNPEVSLSPVTCASFRGLFFLIREVPVGRIVRLSLSGTCRWAFPDPRMPVSFYWVPLVLESAFSDLTGIFLAYRNIPEGRNSCGSELAFLLVSLSDCLLGRLTLYFKFDLASRVQVLGLLLVHWTHPFFFWL